MYEIKFYKLENNKEPVRDWLDSLDNTTRLKIVRRIERIYDGNFGDYKQLASNLYELRFKFGTGYRIYYTIRNGIVVLLLKAGDKQRQDKDIEIANEYLKTIGDKNERF